MIGGVDEIRPNLARPIRITRVYQQADKRTGFVAI